MSIDEALQYIHSVSWMGTIPGLDRIAELLDRLGNPQAELKFVHIAGTNGKGSTAAMLASVLHSAGYRTGLYTSPYLLRFNERIQVNGEQITDSDLCKMTDLIRPHADAMAQHPTEFETVTAIGFEYFRRRRCDIVICEVGMGGEWDATNVIRSPECSVITNIGLDHTGILGDTVEQIAHTKAGIVKPGCPCVLYRQTPQVEAVFKEVCTDRQAPLVPADFESLHPLSAGLDGQCFDWGEYAGLRIPLLGPHQLKNACTALTAIRVLREIGWQIHEDAVRSGLAKVDWPGRFQLLCKEPLFIADGGHNPQCLEALEDALRACVPGKKPVFLCGCMADKDYKAMFRSLLPLASEFVTVTPRNPRALSAEELCRFLTEDLNAAAVSCPSVEAGVREAISRAGVNGVVCACGSLYMLGDVMEALERWKTDNRIL